MSRPGRREPGSPHPGRVCGGERAVTPEDATVGPAAGRTDWLEHDVRNLAAAATAGAAAGLVINGIGSRIAMLLLARLNPKATGRVSDDGFVIGQFVLIDTLNLLFAGTVFGVLGGLVFLAVRQLRFGPAWFQTASITIGPAVVVGAMLVHTSGIDFRLLQPAWLAIALFVALPGLFAFTISRLVDRWAAEGSWFRTGSRNRLWALTPLGFALPFAPLLAVAALARAVYQSVPRLRSARVRRGVHLVARAGLVGVFMLGAVDLTRDVLVLV
jgi:hypothetical protein